MKTIATYSSSTLTGDVLAGISVAIVIIPQSLAYAQIAGLPPHIGLFAAALPLVIASFFVSSPYLQTGPVALTSLLTLGALRSLEPEGSAEYIQLAAMLAIDPQTSFACDEVGIEQLAKDYDQCLLYRLRRAD